MSLPHNKTKIVCTIGPASESPEIMRQLMEAGMNVARINFSFGNFSSHKKVIENLRRASTATGYRLAIMADLSGPKMRIGQLTSDPIKLRLGDTFTLTTDEITGDNLRVSVSFEGLPQAVKPGDILYLNDGYIELRVLKIQGNDVICTVEVGGELRSHKGLNLPGIDLGISAFTKRDYECLKFALENGVDAVSQSFVENASDIEAVRKASQDLGYHPFIIAKIERSRALDHIDEIIDAADGIMIARGDLGVEVPIEQIAVVQQDLMRHANVRAKPVITATQMLESMTLNRLPTRAEATDVANAILNGTDCVMLSGESAMGNYPVESVEMLARIAAAVEPNRHIVTVKEMFKDFDHKGNVLPEQLIAVSVEASLEYVTPAAIFVPTHSGATARRIARFRLPSWIIALSAQESTCNGLQFTYGVYPVHETGDPENWKPYVKEWVQRHEITGDIAILTGGPSSRYPDANHRMEVIDLTSSEK
ncbi:MAG: pyruvate kinase [Methanosarcinales archaeon]|nr:pyruvate kinase [Methanosarcinales archaeon]